MLKLNVELANSNIYLVYGNQSFLHPLGMRRNLIFIFVFFVKLIEAQTLTIKPAKYYVNSMFDKTTGAKYACDKDSRFQDELVFYTIEQRDTVILFKSAIYNNSLKGVSEWFNAEGHLIRQTINYEGGCTVHASTHHFNMASSIKMKIPALIEKSTFWDNYPPYSKEVEEFYIDGLLTKRINYYQNGNRYLVAHFALKKNYTTTYYSKEYDEYEESGEYIVYFPNGGISMQGTKLANKNIGQWKYYTEEGKLETEKFYYNADSVLVSYFYPSGVKKKQELLWLEHPVGESFTYYETGEIESKKVFSKYGRQIDSELKYYKSRKLMEEIPCCGTFKTGTYKKWFENGKLAETYNLVESYKRGKYESWHENGILKTKGQYDTLGYSVGKWYTYNEKGKLVSVRDYDKEIMETPEVLSEEIITYAVDAPIADRNYKEFSQVLAKSTIFENRFKYSRDLHFLKKQKQLEVKATLNEKGFASYEIITPLSEKQKLKLKEYLEKKIIFDNPFRIGYTNVPCSIDLLIEIWD